MEEPLLVRETKRLADYGIERRIGENADSDEDDDGDKLSAASAATAMPSSDEWLAVRALLTPRMRDMRVSAFDPAGILEIVLDYAHPSTAELDASAPVELRGDGPDDPTAARPALFSIPLSTARLLLRDRQRPQTRSAATAAPTLSPSDLPPLRATCAPSDATGRSDGDALRGALALDADWRLSATVQCVYPLPPAAAERLVAFLRGAAANGCGAPLPVTYGRYRTVLSMRDVGEALAWERQWASDVDPALYFVLARFAHQFESLRRARELLEFAASLASYDAVVVAIESADRHEGVSARPNEPAALRWALATLALAACASVALGALLFACDVCAVADTPGGLRLVGLLTAVPAALVAARLLLYAAAARRHRTRHACVDELVMPIAGVAWAALVVWASAFAWGRYGALPIAFQIASLSACAAALAVLALYREHNPALLPFPAGRATAFSRYVAPPSPRRGERYGNCVAGDTLIATVRGNVRADRVGVDDLVAGLCLASGTLRIQRVRRVVTGVAAAESRCRLVLGNGRQMVCTREHPVLTGGRGWVDAGKLRAGDVVAAISADGTPATTTIRAIHLAERGARLPVFTFTTTPDHNFVASGVVVHNKM